MTAERPVVPAEVDNPPGLSRLSRRVSDYARAMRRMRGELAADGRDAAVRAVARHGLDDPVVALLDGWAVVSDTVTFYTELIADEGYLRTAQQPGSVRELALSVGYEPDPGVAAEVDLAVTADSGPLVPEVVTIPAGTAVQSVPAESTFDGPPLPSARPQTFETLAAADVRAAWNALPVFEDRPQNLAGATAIWLPGTVTLRPGDPVLIDDMLRTVTFADTTARTGWTRVHLDAALGGDAVVRTSAKRARLFGWNAPDPNLLVINGKPPVGITGNKRDGYSWDGFPMGSGELELDGEFPEIAPGSWLVVQPGDGTAVALQAGSIRLDGQSRFGVSGPITRVTPDTAPDPELQFDRRRAVVHCVSVTHDTGREPADGLLTVDTVAVPPFSPPLPDGHRLLLVWDGGERRPRSAAVTVRHSQVAAGRVYLTVDGDLSPVPARGLAVRANVVRRRKSGRSSAAATAPPPSRPSRCAKGR